TVLFNRDSDQAHLHLGTHGLTRPKCQKFEGIPIRCGEKSPTASGVLILPGATALVFAKGLASNLSDTLACFWGPWKADQSSLGNVAPPISYDSADRGVALGPGPPLGFLAALLHILGHGELAQGGISDRYRVWLR